MAKAQIESLPEVKIIGTPETKTVATRTPEVSANGDAKVIVKEVIIAVPFAELPEHGYEGCHVNIQLPRPLAKVLRRMTQGLANQHAMVGEHHVNRRDYGRALQWLLTKVSE